MASLGAFMLVLLFGISTRAEGTGDTPDRILVQAVLRNGRPDAELSTELGKRLTQSGEVLVSGVALGAAEQTCSDYDCWKDLTERARADLLVHATVTPLQDEYLLNIFLFVAETGRTWKEQGVRAPAGRVAELLTESVGHLLARQREPPPPPTTSPPPSLSEVAPRPQVAPRGPLPRWRKRLAAGLGGAAVAAAGAGVALTLLDGRLGPGDCPFINFNGNCQWQTVPAYSASYAAAGALLVGVALTLALPTERRAAPPAVATAAAGQP